MPMKSVDDLEESIDERIKMLEENAVSSSSKCSLEHKYATYTEEEIRKERSSSYEEDYKYTEKKIKIKRIVPINKETMRFFIEEESLILKNVKYLYFFYRGRKYKVESTGNDLFSFGREAQIYGVPLWVLMNLKMKNSFNCFVTQEIYSLPRFNDALKEANIEIIEVRDMMWDPDDSTEEYRFGTTMMRRKRKKVKGGYIITAKGC